MVLDQLRTVDQERLVQHLGSIAPMPSAFPHHGVWRTWTTLHGLPSLQLHAIAEDPQGYLWLATLASGLCRFDGEEFLPFTTADGLPSNRLYALLVDQQDRLWIGMGGDGGLAWYDGRAFHRVGEPQPVTALAEDEQGRIWFCGGAYMGYYDGSTVQVLSAGYVGSHGSQEVGACWGIVPDVEGQVWFGAGGLVGYDGTTFHCHRDADLPLPHEDNVAIGRHPDGGLWVGWGRQVWHYHEGRFEPTGLPIEGCVRAIRPDLQGRTWFCMETSGAFCYDGNEVHHLTPADGLAHASVVDLCQVREGLLWFPTWGGGLSSYDARSLQQVPVDGPAQEAAALLEDRQGRMWVGWGSEVELWEDVRRASLPLRVGWSVDGQIQPVPVPEGLTAGPCLALCQDRQGQVWLGGGRGGVLCWDGQGFRILPGTEEHLVWAIIEARQGELILGCSAPQGQTGIRLLAYDGQELRCLYHAESRSWVRGLAATPDGDLWFALNPYGGQAACEGLGRLRPDGQATFYTTKEGLADNHVEAVLAGSKGRVWAGTFGGLSCWDGERFRTFTTADGLPNNRVRCLYEEAGGRLWLGTEAGVCQYDGQTFQTVRAAGLVPTQALLQDRHGVMWCATGTGAWCYTPGQVPPRVRLLPVLADRTYPADGAVEVPVSSGQVIFEYQGMSYRTPLAGLRYTWRLQGIESEWQPATSVRRAVYPGLAAGSYTFEVRAIDQDLNHSEPAAVTLTVVEEMPQDRLTGELIGNSVVMRGVRRRLLTAAQDHLAVLLLGETGSGKGLAAEMVHRHSARGQRVMVQVNCGGLPAGLIENELFGHDKEAFTGAANHRKGRVERADRSTLFLDEVAELPLESQGKLLQVLDGKGFERLGGDRTIPVDVRVIAATNRDLEQMVQEDRFRKDLYHRLTGHTIKLPPLRDRREDIPDLATHFLHLAVDGRRPVPRVSLAAMLLLQAHDWPGNVRDLIHEMVRAAGVCGEEVLPEHLSFSPRETTASADPGWTPEEYERWYLQTALAKTNGVIKGPHGAAALVKMKPSTLRHRLSRLGLR